MNESTTKYLSIGLAGAGLVFLLGGVYLGSATHSGGSNPALTPLLIAGGVMGVLAILVYLFGGQIRLHRSERARPYGQPPFTGHAPQTQPRVEDYDDYPPAYAPQAPQATEFAGQPPQAPAGPVGYVPPPLYDLPAEQQPSYPEPSSEGDWGDESAPHIPQPQQSNGDTSGNPFAGLI